jgi:type IV secretory pathway VirB2 component (pilin)
MYLGKSFAEKTVILFSISFLMIVSFAFFAVAAVDFAEEETVSNAPSNANNAKATTSPRTANTKLKFAENNPIASLLCKAIRAFTGTIAKVIAVFMILGLGITMLQATSTNPVSPVVIVSLILGIAILLSAEKLVGIFTGDSGYGGEGAGLSCDCKHGLNGDCEKAV